MAKLPKALIKKYGISKKAWAVFRGSKKSKSSPKLRARKTKSRGLYMARRKKARSYKKGGSMNKIFTALMGVAGAVVYEVFISPKIPLSRNTKNMLELGIGIALMVMPRVPKVLKATGLALVVINGFEILVPLVSGAKSISTNGGNVTAY